MTDTAPIADVAPEDQPEPIPVPETPRARVADELNKAETREEVLGLAIGAASSCWSNLSGAGTFESDEAARILDATLARLAELDKTAERERRAAERKAAREKSAAADAKGGE